MKKRAMQFFDSIVALNLLYFFPAGVLVAFAILRVLSDGEEFSCLTSIASLLILSAYLYIHTSFCILVYKFCGNTNKMRLRTHIFVWGFTIFPVAFLILILPFSILPDKTFFEFNLLQGVISIVEHRKGLLGSIIFINIFFVFIAFVVMARDAHKPDLLFYTFFAFFLFVPLLVINYLSHALSIAVFQISGLIIILLQFFTFIKIISTLTGKEFFQYKKTFIISFTTIIILFALAVMVAYQIEKQYVQAKGYFEAKSTLSLSKNESDNIYFQSNPISPLNISEQKNDIMEDFSEIKYTNSIYLPLSKITLRSRELILLCCEKNQKKITMVNDILTIPLIFDGDLQEKHIKEKYLIEVFPNWLYAYHAHLLAAILKKDQDSAFFFFTQMLNIRDNAANFVTEPKAIFYKNHINSNTIFALGQLLSSDILSDEQLSELFARMNKFEQGLERKWKRYVFFNTYADINRFNLDLPFTTRFVSYCNNLRRVTNILRNNSLLIQRSPNYRDIIGFQIFPAGPLKEPPPFYNAFYNGCIQDLICTICMKASISIIQRIRISNVLPEQLSDFTETASLVYKKGNIEIPSPQRFPIFKTKGFSVAYTDSQNIALGVYVERNFGSR